MQNIKSVIKNKSYYYNVFTVSCLTLILMGYFYLHRLIEKLHKPGLNTLVDFLPTDRCKAVTAGFSFCVLCLVSVFLSLLHLPCMTL